MRGLMQSGSLYSGASLGAMGEIYTGLESNGIHVKALCKDTKICNSLQIHLVKNGNTVRITVV